MISAQQISKYYGAAKAVDDISFEVKEGENLVLLGTSGCGKTTTLKMINRLISLSSGKITVNGKNINEQSAELLRRSIGYVLQHNSLFPHFTVAENIAIVPELLKWDKNKIKVRTEELAEKLSLPADQFLSVYPGELSGGQQQRVNIARALAANPPILLMDEPFGALDAITRTAIQKEFAELDELKRKTIVLVTHDVREAFLLGDRICIMDQGRIMQQGPPAELLFNPANDFVREFLSSSYLELALSTIKAADIWDRLDVKPTGTENENVMSAASSLWDMMEAATKNKISDHLYIRDKTNNIVQISKKDISKFFTELYSTNNTF